jgi:hypothetical protein
VREFGPFLFLLVVACGDASAPESDRPDPENGGNEVAATAGSNADGTGEVLPEEGAERDAHESMLDRDYPLHGLVTGLQLPVRREPNPESDPVGWLRIGNRVRLKTDSTRTSTCNSGWYEVYPQGFACAGQGIEIGDEPPESDLAVAPPARDAALPYDYYFVKDGLVPEFHQAPSRDAQRGAAELSERVLELRRSEQDRLAQRVLDGELPNQPQKPAAVHRFLERGFFVAGVGVETRASRRFVRTVRGRYLREAQLLPRTGSEFTGVELSEERTLPVAWVVRGTELRERRERYDGEIAFVRDLESEPLERHQLVEDWEERINEGGQVMHRLGRDRYVREWFLAVAEAHERPREVGEDEPWVHVDLHQQTLVLYEGDRPVFATLVSSGQEGFETATGLFQIRRKYIADTMANIGDGNDEQYSIEDVPWTQYFSGSLALHGAFWHDRFGLTRSHGCVNLSPRDAHRVFDALWPRVPEGWLGVTTEHDTFRASHVLVTD